VNCGEETDKPFYQYNKIYDTEIGRSRVVRNPLDPQNSPQPGGDLPVGQIVDEAASDTVPPVGASIAVLVFHPTHTLWDFRVNSPSFFPSPPDFRCHGRDAARGGPRGGGAIQGRARDRAHLSAHSHRAAVDEGVRGYRGGAGHRALHDRRPGSGPKIDERCAALGLPYVSVIEPVLAVFQSYLGAPAGRRVGAQHALDAEYFRRIDALNFTMEHDDGQLPDDIEEADIVLSAYPARPRRRPASISPIAASRPPICRSCWTYHSRSLLTPRRKPLIVGLVASAERISQVARIGTLGAGYDAGSYVDRRPFYRN
jgi:hypothetical protein